MTPLRREAEDPGAADDVEVLAIGDGRAEDSVRPVPDLLPRQRVESVGPTRTLLRIAGSDAAAGRTCREVDESVDHAGRSVDRRRRREAPEPVARRGVEGHEVAVIRADVHAAVPDRRRGVDVRACALRPEHPAARRSEGVERPVRVPDEDPSVRDGRRRVEVLAPTEAGKRLGAPPHSPRPPVERVEASSVRSEVDLPAAVRRRAVDLAVGRERPARLAGVDIDRVELVVPGTGVERLPDHERRGLEGTRPELPDDLSRACGHRGDQSRLTAWKAPAGQGLHPGVVDDAVGDGRRRSRTMVEMPFPDHLPRPVVDGDEPSTLVGEIETAVGNRRRKLEHVPGLECPAQAVRRP
jgi:hypothetical protein